MGGPSGSDSDSDSSEAYLRVAGVLTDLIGAAAGLGFLYLQDVAPDVFDAHTQHEVPAVLWVLR